MLARHARCTCAKLGERLHRCRATTPRHITTAATRAPASTAPDSQVRTGPPPVRVAFTESAGRGVFATRSIVAGELIHSAEPVVCHPSLDALHTVCYSCLKVLGGSRVAPPTGEVSFCSERCREQSKGFYEVEKRTDCSAYHEYCRTHKLKYPLLVKRLACMVVAGTAHSECLDILQPAYLSTEMITKMEEEFKLLKSSFTEAGLMDAQIACIVHNWYADMLSRIRINAFRVGLIGGSYEDLLSMAATSVEAETAVGNAVYMLPSFYNHDCDPNTHIIWPESAVARLKALRDIQPGEELRICYIDASLGRDARQALLSQGFGFHCSCERCLSGD